MKKLLILGGGVHESFLVNRAHLLGYYTIVTEHYDNGQCSPAKQYANESWDISWNDTDRLCEQCKSIGVNGVIAGFSEYKVEALIRLTEKLGLPCYCTMDQLNVTREKNFFKKTCRKYGLPTVHEFLSKCDVTDEDFPVIVKPVDRGGSIGITTAFNKEELDKSVEYALSLSDSKQIVIERFMRDYTKFDVYYLIIDGKYYYFTSSDTQMHQLSAGTETLQKIWTYPSRFEKSFLKLYDEKIQNMLKGCGIKQGYITISAFAKGDEFYFFETGFRLSGEHSFDISEMNIGINYIDYMIAIALGEDTSKFKPCYSDRTLYSIVLNYAGNVGKAMNIYGIDKIKELPCLRSLVQYKKEGDIVGTDEKPHPRVAMISLCSFDKELLIENARIVMDSYDVVDANECSLLLEKPSEDNFKCMEFI